MTSLLAGKKTLGANIDKARVVLGAQTTGRGFIAGWPGEVSKLVLLSVKKRVQELLFWFRPNVINRDLRTLRRKSGPQKV
jgi:hypothetical protein